MAWVKVPTEHHPIFRAALPNDLRVETMAMFGGVAAKANDHIFAGLFGRSVMLLLDEPDRSTALALEGARLFDPMGNGPVRSDKVMLPEAMMEEPDELRRWIVCALASAAALPRKIAAKANPAAKKTAAASAEAPEKSRTVSAARAGRRSVQHTRQADCGLSRGGAGRVAARNSEPHCSKGNDDRRVSRHRDARATLRETIRVECIMWSPAVSATAQLEGGRGQAVLRLALQAHVGVD